MCTVEKLSELMQQALKGIEEGVVPGKCTVDAQWNVVQHTSPEPASPVVVDSVRLGEDMAARLFEVAPTVPSTARTRRCMHELQQMISHFGPDWELRPFGSYANGFSTVYSDLDVTCYQSGQLSGAEVQRFASMALSEWMLPQLKAHPRFSIIEEVLGARVPILKLCYEDMLEVDLSCHNLKPLLNTRLLKAYCQMDPRIRDLVVAIKLWAKGVGVCDATKSNLSSYAFTLLLVYFLQVHQDVQLPVLPVEAFEEHGRCEADERVIAAMSSWQCGLSLAELVIRFFAFYSNHEPNAFLWGSEVVSVRCGCRYAAREPAFVRLRGRQNWRIHIEDPYELERNLHGVLGKAEEEQLLSALNDAWYHIQSNLAPYGLRPSRGLPGVYNQMGLTQIYPENSAMVELKRAYVAGTAYQGDDIARPQHGTVYNSDMISGPPVGPNTWWQQGYHNMSSQGFNSDSTKSGSIESMFSDEESSGDNVAARYSSTFFPGGAGAISNTSVSRMHSKTVPAHIPGKVGPPQSGQYNRCEPNITSQRGQYIRTEPNIAAGPNSLAEPNIGDKPNICDIPMPKFTNRGSDPSTSTGGYRPYPAQRVPAATAAHKPHKPRTAHRQRF